MTQPLLTRLLAWLRADRPVEPRHPPTTHDYARPRWGHACIVAGVSPDGARVRAYGWGVGIRPGDYLILPSDGGDRRARYQVESVGYESDPRDMWHAIMVFAPRPDVVPADRAVR